MAGKIDIFMKIIGPDGRVYAASANTTMVVVPSRGRRHRSVHRR